MKGRSEGARARGDALWFENLPRGGELCKHHHPVDKGCYGGELVWS